MKSGTLAGRTFAVLSILGTLSLSMPLTALADPLPPVAKLSLQGATGPVVGIIAECTGLKKKILSAAKDGLSSLADSLAGGSTSVTGIVTEGTSALGGLDSVPVSDATVQKTAARIQKNSATTAESTSTTTQKDCWRTMERAFAQIILKQITKDTITWINSGFRGGPFYVQDTGNFLKQIRNQAIGDFTSTIAFDPEKYPFGKVVAQGLINDVNGYFEKNAQYSLNKVIAQQVPGATAIDFEANFADGGWRAFQSQFDLQNNPYGFQMYAQDTIAARIQGTYYSPAEDLRDQIMRSGGFLDMRTCVDPVDYDENDPNDRCYQWRTETPGSVIVSQLNQTLGAPTQQLALGQDITEDLIAIIDALLNQGVKYGLSKINTDKL